jgi:PAS domain S-box-containing protein
MSDTSRTAPIFSPVPALESDGVENKERLLAERLNDVLWQSNAYRQHWQDWLNFAMDGYLLTDAHGVIHEANYAAAKLLGARKEFLLGKPLGLFMKDPSRWLFYVRLARLADWGGIERWEMQVCRPGGQPRDVTLTAAVLTDERSRDIKVRWMLHDVSVARQTERAWQNEKNLSNSLLEMAEIFILLVDERGIILRCNPYTLKISGYCAEELHEQNWPHLFLPDEDREAGKRLLHEARTNGSAKSGVLALAGRTGARHRVIWSARQLGRSLLLIGQDVTELQEAQRQALQAERLATIGQVSAGLAHEARNALQRIQACVSLLTIRLNDQPENMELLGRIQKAQDDLQRLFEDVRTYAVASRLQPHWSDLRQCWREAWNDLASLRPTAELREDIAGVNPFCAVDPFYLKQVFRNLLENALSSGADPVRILIQCLPAKLGEEDAICIRLRDNGPGIPEEVRPQLFEPFFTTKLRGTGLGLAICKRIIDAHGGRIEASNEAVSGAELVITLPRRAP